MTITKLQVIGLLMPFFTLVYAIAMALGVRYFLKPTKHQAVGQPKPARR